MGQQIDRFCEELRTTLTSIDSRFTSLKSKIDAKSQGAEREVRSQLDQARKRIDQNHAQVAAAQARVKDWAETRKAATAEKIAEWKAKFDATRLRNHADAAERYAADTLEMALSAVDVAERAALYAWVPGRMRMLRRPPKETETNSHRRRRRTRALQRV